MPKTAQQIMQEAYATSRLNDAGRIAEEAGELLALINELLKAYTAEGARLNRKLFADRLEATKDVGGFWARPVTAELVFRIEAGDDTQDGAAQAIAEGTEIIELPFDERDIETHKPAVYELGQKYYAAGRAGDPATGKLVFLSPVTPTDLAAAAEELPDTWPETAGNPLLKWDLAIYLAQKDGERDNEVAAFTTLRDRAHERFLAFCKTASSTEVRTFGPHGV